MTPDTQCVKGLVVNYFSLGYCMTPDTQCVKGLVVCSLFLDCTTPI